MDGEGGSWLESRLMSLENPDLRSPSLLDASCEVFVHDLAALSPTDATAWEIPGFEGELEDFSPEYWDAVAARVSEMVADIDALDDGTDDSDDDDDFDEVDQITATVMRDRLGVISEKHHQGEYLRLLNSIASPVQTIRDALVLMPHSTPEDLEAVRSRLSKVGTSLAGYQASLAEAANYGEVAARRQVDEVISQCEVLAGSGSLLEELGLDPYSTEVLAAKEAFGRMAEWLGTYLAPVSAHEDAVGRERYELFSHEFLGDSVDLDEAYLWGLEQLWEITSAQQFLAAQLYGKGTTINAAISALNTEERYRIQGTDALREWMQETADKAIRELDGTHFTIPEPVKTIEACIDPTGTGDIFYIPPSDDFSRPGRIWWPVSEDKEVFHTWRELTTVFHESVPGHHLQFVKALEEVDNFNLWHRVACWNYGDGQGWASYAELLMAELGYHEDLGTRMGLLDAQRLRAARVVLDIGVHLGKKIPEGTGVWNASYAKSFLRENTTMDEASLGFELHRCLGLPGHALSSALGQRHWLQLRDDALTQGMSLRDFHNTALSYGSIPMSILREQILD